MRRALIFTLGALLADGCKGDGFEECSATYTSNNVVLELGPRELVLRAACAGGPLFVRMCVGVSCSETHLLPGGGCEHERLSGTPSLVCEGEPGWPASFGTPAAFTLLALLDGQSFGRQAVSLTVQSNDGKVVLQEERELTFEGSASSARDCGTGSVDAPPERFDLSAGLAGLAGGCDAVR